MRLDRALAHLERYPFHMPGHKRNPDFVCRVRKLILRK